jgi:16S rRNA (uracil1498-N3)-methyltransferase
VPPRFYLPTALAAAAEFDLPAGASRHVQVLRLQPGASITLFNGAGGEWSATVLAMGRTDVHVRVDAFVDVNRELPLRVTLALGMPANERMDALVEKATELGVATIQPLHCARSVLRLKDERAARRNAHWQAVAQAACEQCGRTRVPIIEPVRDLTDWLSALRAEAHRWLLSAGGGALAGPGAERLPRTGDVICLSGPEGGLTDEEVSFAQLASFTPVSLGPRVLRADTAPLALLAHLACCASGTAPSNQGNP